MTHHIIVIGAARSGTKILRDVLAEASGAGRVPYDIGFVWRYANEQVTHDVLDPALATPRVRRFIHRYVNRYARGDRDVVIEKTVGNTLRVPFVHAVMPYATFIHIVRDGTDAVESARRQWAAAPEPRYLWGKVQHFPLRFVPSYGRKYVVAQLRRRRGSGAHAATWGPRYPGIDEDVTSTALLTVCARQWRASVEYATRGLARVDAPVVEVRYDELVAKPRSTLDHLLDRLGLDGPAVLRSRAAARLQASRAGTGSRALSEPERAMIAAELTPMLTTLGYQA